MGVFGSIPEGTLEPPIMVGSTLVAFENKARWEARIKTRP